MDSLQFSYSIFFVYPKYPTNNTWLFYLSAVLFWNGLTGNSCLQQWPPTSWAPGTGFVDRDFSMEQRVAWFCVPPASHGQGFACLRGLFLVCCGPVPIHRLGVGKPWPQNIMENVWKVLLYYLMESGFDSFVLSTLSRYEETSPRTE